MSEMENKRYYLDSSDKIIFDDRTLYRIVALVDILTDDRIESTGVCMSYYQLKEKSAPSLDRLKMVKKGDKGGYIEKEDNLRQKNSCAWVGVGAKVYGDSELHDFAYVGGATTLDCGDILNGFDYVVSDLAPLLVDKRLKRFKKERDYLKQEVEDLKQLNERIYRVMLGLREEKGKENE